MPWVVRDAVLDARGVDTTLLHYAQLNPLWTGWEARPAESLR